MQQNKGSLSCFYGRVLSSLFCHACSYCNHSAKWGKWCSVNTTTEYLACHDLPVSKRTLQINTCILEISIQERLLQCKRHHTDKRDCWKSELCLHSLLYVPHISNKCLKNCWKSPSNTPLQAITGEKTSSIIITYRLLSSLAEIV